MSDYEVRGVRVQDVYRDHDGKLWEVVGLITDPMAVVRDIETDTLEHHVIGCRNWTAKWEQGPLRPEPITELLPCDRCGLHYRGHVGDRCQVIREGVQCEGHLHRPGRVAVDPCRVLICDRCDGHHLGWVGDPCKTPVFDHHCPGHLVEEPDHA